MPILLMRKAMRRRLCDLTGHIRKWQRQDLEVHLPDFRAYTELSSEIHCFKSLKMVF